MSDEARMNSDQMELESRLGRLTIPVAPIDRDELMYQSGWAAALTSLGHSADDAVPPVSIRRSRWVWPAAAFLSSAAAAMLLVALVLQSSTSPGSGPNPLVASGNAAAARQMDVQMPVEQELSAAKVELRADEREFANTDFAQRILELPVGTKLKSGVSFQELARMSDSRNFPSQYLSVTDGGEPLQGHRQLMMELLPARR